MLTSWIFFLTDVLGLILAENKLKRYLSFVVNFCFFFFLFFVQKSENGDSHIYRGESESKMDILERHRCNVIIDKNTAFIRHDRDHHHSSWRFSYYSHTVQIVQRFTRRSCTFSFYLGNRCSLKLRYSFRTIAVLLHIIVMRSSWRNLSILEETQKSINLYNRIHFSFIAHTFPLQTQIIWVQIMVLYVIS